MTSKNARKAKAGVFIDGSNLFFAQKDEDNYYIDFEKLKKHLKQHYSPMFYNYYSGVDLKPRTLEFEEKAKKALRFHNKLNGIGYNVVTKPLKYIGNKTKCDMDVEISMAMRDALDDVDNIILISGDSDFLTAVQHCHGKNKYIRIYSFRNFLSWELKEFALKQPRCNFRIFDDLKDEIEYVRKNTLDSGKIIA